ncbi:GGDEF domain-containing phosphodiesterase [Pseudoalteromonas sp. Of11M-6]|uniref:EAL domain-containing protein n=1 Tax=Pseudoalteromonas sp. Of11M-6 TaxID=2917754 RepID=UPI001EF65BA4|nr:GGDEF domain-containing phosphodiesterase [Pseudoalteromonas sp. Of11M-6]MCG7554203.1 GGDEF domain-containing phosphodiesterase [Pseudoalteromonas sp. Of11M-6]
MLSISTASGGATELLLSEGIAILITPMMAGMAGAIVMGALALMLQRPSGMLKLAHLSSATLAILLAFTGNITTLHLLTLTILLYLFHGLQEHKSGLLLISAAAIITLVMWTVSEYLWTFPAQHGAIVIVFMYILFLAYQAYSSANEFELKEHNDDHTEHESLGLPGRQSFKRAFNEYRQTGGSPCMLVLVRLMGFEQVNFHLGREFGDLLLAQSANRIAQCLQSGDVMAITHGNETAKMAHLGGLNFAFVCSLKHGKHFHEQLIEEISNSTLKPFNVGSCTLEIMMRASYVNCDEEMGQLENLISCVFLALDTQSEAHQHSHQQVVPYQQRMQIHRLEQQVRLSELAKINFRSEFELYFHPVVRHEDNSIEFVELLLRWQHPKQGILSANEFIDDIRLVGLAIPVAEYVLERACEIALALKMEGISVPISINVFGAELLSESFIEFIDYTMLNHQLSPGAIIIECPASMLAELDEQEIAMISRLKNLGVKMCVDSFGDAPLVLAKLPALRFEYVKLSRNMTQEPEHMGHTKSLVKGIVEMHQEKHCRVIGEGIESLGQLEFVKSIGTVAAQGFYFSRPQNSNILISWLKQRLPQ